jgi:hypothetical protein
VAKALGELQEGSSGSLLQGIRHADSYAQFGERPDQIEVLLALRDGVGRGIMRRACDRTSVILRVPDRRAAKGLELSLGELRQLRRLVHDLEVSDGRGRRTRPACNKSG